MNPIDLSNTERVELPLSDNLFEEEKIDLDSFESPSIGQDFAKMNRGFKITQEIDPFKEDYLPSSNNNNNEDAPDPEWSKFNKRRRSLSVKKPLRKLGKKVVRSSSPAATKIDNWLKNNNFPNPTLFCEANDDTISCCLIYCDLKDNNTNRALAKELMEAAIRNNNVTALNDNSEESHRRKSVLVNQKLQSCAVNWLGKNEREKTLYTADPASVCQNILKSREYINIANSLLPNPSTEEPFVELVESFCWKIHNLWNPKSTKNKEELSEAAEAYLNSEGDGITELFLTAPELKCLPLATAVGRDPARTILKELTPNIVAGTFLSVQNEGSDTTVTIKAEERAESDSFTDARQVIITHETPYFVVKADNITVPLAFYIAKWAITVGFEFQNMPLFASLEIHSVKIFKEASEDQATQIVKSLKKISKCEKLFTIGRKQQNQIKKVVNE